MGLQYSDIKDAAQSAGMVPDQALAIARIAQLAVQDMNSERADYRGNALSTSNAPYKATARELLYRYSKYGAKGRDTSNMINCHQLVGSTVYADLTAAQTAFPAAANTNKAAYVGSGVAVSNGTAWVVTTNIAVYLNTGVVSTGYTDADIFSLYTINATGPDSGLSSQLLGKVSLSGGVPQNVGNAGNFPDIGWYSDGGTFTKGGGGVYRSAFTEPKPILKVQKGNYNYVVRILTPSGYVFLNDPNLLETTTNGGIQFPAAFAPAGGGVVSVQLDFSQLTGFSQYSIEVLCGSECILRAVAIRAAYYFVENKKKFGLRGVIAGDSVVNTINDSSIPKAGHHPCYSQHLRYLFGIEDFFVMSEGGTGFINTNSGAGRRHVDKLKYLMKLGAYNDMDFLILPMSVNDGEDAQIETYMREALVFGALSLPSTLILVPGPTAGNYTAGQAIEVRAANRGKALVNSLGLPNVVYVPTMDLPTQPITGNGIFGGAQDGGTSDWIFNTGDGTHFGARGHKYWAESVVAPSIATELAKFVNA